jgi:hypothetical protein
MNKNQLPHLIHETMIHRAPSFPFPAASTLDPQPYLVHIPSVQENALQLNIMV